MLLFQNYVYLWLCAFQYNFIFYSGFMTLYRSILNQFKCQPLSDRCNSPHYFLSRKSFPRSLLETGMSLLNFTLPQGLAKVDGFLLSVSLNPCSCSLCAASLHRQPHQPSPRYRSFSNSHNFPEKLFSSKHRDPHWIHHCRASFLRQVGGGGKSRI